MSTGESQRHEPARQDPFRRLPRGRRRFQTVRHCGVLRLLLQLLRCDKTRPPFWSHFILNNAQFTKTGSGQTYEKLWKKRRLIYVGGKGAPGSITVSGGTVKGTVSFGAAVYAHGVNDPHVTFSGKIDRERKRGTGCLSRACLGKSSFPNKRKRLQSINAPFSHIMLCRSDVRSRGNHPRSVRS